MSRCGCCPGGIRGLFGGKLGKCPRCMRLAAAGTAAGGGLAAAAQGVGAPAAVAALALVLAAPFAILLAAHASVFLRAARRARAAAGPGPGERILLDRRAFVGAGALAFCAVLLGAPLPGWAKDNPGSCKQDAAGACKGDCGTVYDAAGNETRLVCTDLTVDGVKDCYCVHHSAGLCNSERQGNCLDDLCPDRYSDKHGKDKLEKKCLKDVRQGFENCYCAYTKK